MSRWETLPSNTRTNPTFYPQNSPVASDMASRIPSGNIASQQQAGYVAGTGPDEVNQHGSIGRFLGKELEGGYSSFIRCIYQAKRTNNQTVTLVCERAQDCCENGCCPKDPQWMAAVYVLLAFVLLVFVVGTVLMIVCYIRSKRKMRKEESEFAAATAVDYNGYASSQIGGPTAYGNYGGPY